MRIVVRFLGVDVFEWATGRDAQPAEEPLEEAGPSAVSPDLTVSTWRLKPGSFPIDDDRVVED